MIFLTGLLIFSAFVRELLLFFAPHFSFDLSPLCLKVLPNEVIHREVLACFLCGQKITDPLFAENLQRTALIHLLIFSGARLAIFEELLKILRIPEILRALLSGVCVLLTGARPSATRGYVRLRLPRFRSAWGPPGRSDLEVFKAGLFTLAIVPSWILSMGITISWAASLGLSLPLGKGWKGALRRLIALWVCVSPLLLQWGFPVPVTWLLHLLITPFFAAVTLPLALLSLFDGKATIPFDHWIEFSTRVLSFLAHEIPETPSTAALPIPWQWLWISSLHIVIHGFLIYWRRPK